MVATPNPKLLQKFNVIPELRGSPVRVEILFGQILWVNNKVQRDLSSFFLMAFSQALESSLIDTQCKVIGSAHGTRAIRAAVRGIRTISCVVNSLPNPCVK